MLAALTLFLFYGCAQLPPHQSNTLDSPTYPSSGEETARNLTAAYQNTAADCGAPTTPAFLCSGVILRITKTSDNYDPWDHSDFSKKTDAVSFSYLRADAKFVRVPWYGGNGLIFYPYLNAPPDKSRPEIICYFPLDGATFYRDAAGQYGCRDSIVPPRVFPDSIPCREQSIVTAEQWVAHYQTATPYKTAHSCAFMVTNSLDAEAVQAFNQAIRVRSLIPTEALADHNELRIKAWPENQPGTLPIQAFFYIGPGLENAQIDQRKYYERTGGIVVPIISLTLPTTASEDATFVYNAADQAVLPELPGKIKPKVPKTYNTAGDHLKMSDIYTDAHVDVEVPHYTDMHATDTIRVRWHGRVNYNSPIIEVGDPPGKRLIPVPRLEVVDNIGRSVEVGYSVKEKGIGETIESSRLTLHIDPQTVHPLPPPRYSASQVTVDNDSLTGYSIRARWTGVMTHDTESQSMTPGQANVFNIPDTWITENSGKTVLVNYSIVRNNSSEQRMFSQVLRINIASPGR
ncbi:hypothetical protein EGM97_25295 [Pseudomonas sp. AF32]|uniref:hypothetical protein n=1 Tax=Pseudomonas sp. AF32 TaxID=554390 RepID=UPI001EEDABEF|nr:hypothetical protein [Pseudomonas sp. AF32]MCG6578003.1 hypothetical protein [Pseudomonas sp. AF32]